MTTLQAAARRVRTPSAPVLVAVFLVALTLAAAPWADRMLVATPGLVPAWLAVVLSCNTITAVLLLGRSRGGASPRLVVLAAAFLWSAALVVGIALATPGVLTTQAVIADPDVLSWFWLAQHTVPPAGIALALAPWPQRWRFGVTEEAMAEPAAPTEAVDPSQEAHSQLISRVVVPVLLVPVGLIALGFAVPSWFSGLGARADASGLGSRASTGELVVVTAVNAICVATALVGIRLRHSRSRLEAWAVVAALALLGEVLMFALVEPVYTVGHLVGRLLGLVASLMVLGFVLNDTFALHRRTAQDAAHLEQQNSELRDAGKLRDHLVAVVSHEMRTPLAGLQGYLELMSEGIDPDPATSARMLERSWLLTRRLTLLTEDLLAVATAEHGEFALIPETVHLAHQLDETAACFPDLDLRIDCPPGLLLRADSLRLQQVLTNLVRNAQKHGAEPVTITCVADATRVTIRVADSGAGVPRDFVHRLFERYAQGANRRSSGGSGLGLAVVRDLVRAHGGSVRYDLTNPAFVVVFPRHLTRAAGQPPTPAPVTLAAVDCAPCEELAATMPPSTLPTELLGLPLESDVDVPDTLSGALAEPLADVIGGVTQPPSAPASALEAFVMMGDDRPVPGETN